MMSLTHFFFFALHRFSATARAATRATAKRARANLKCERAAPVGRVMMRASDNDYRGTTRNTVAIKVVVVENE